MMRPAHPAPLCALPTRGQNVLRSVTFVLPVLNEADNIPTVLDSIPESSLSELGYDVETLVVDNGSTDGSDTIARSLGARVIYQPLRGYGNAYQAGFQRASGDIIVTGDADCTYPFDDAPRLISILQDRGLDFLNTNRLHVANYGAMTQSHRYANRFLSALSRTVHKSPFLDSQSGMWVFKREILSHLHLMSPGMAFSQEIKHEVHRRGFACGEELIEYRVRGGDVKLNAARDGIGNTIHILSHRMRRTRSPQTDSLAPARRRTRPVAWRREGPTSQARSR